MKRKLLLAGIKGMTRGIIPIVVFLSGIFFPLGNHGLAASVTLTIVHTNNVNGILFACPT